MKKYYVLIIIALLLSIGTLISSPLMGEKSSITTLGDDPIDTRIIDDSPGAKDRDDRVRSNKFFTTTYMMMYDSLLNKEDKNKLYSHSMDEPVKDTFLYFDGEKWLSKKGSSGGVEKINNIDGVIDIVSNDKSIKVENRPGIKQIDMSVSADYLKRPFHGKPSKSLLMYELLNSGDCAWADFIDSSNIKWIIDYNPEQSENVKIASDFTQEFRDHNATKAFAQEEDKKIDDKYAQECGRLDGEISKNRLDIKNKIGDAPIDSDMYVRKAAKWEKLVIDFIDQSCRDYLSAVVGDNFGIIPGLTIKQIINQLKDKQNKLPFDNNENHFVNGKGEMGVPSGVDLELRDEMGKIKTGNPKDWDKESTNLKYIHDIIMKKLPLCSKDNQVLWADKNDTNHRWGSALASFNKCVVPNQNFVVLDKGADVNPKEPMIETNINTGYTYLYIPQLQYDTTEYGVIGKHTVLNITGEEKVATKPSITLKDAKAKIDYNSQILHTNIENSNTVTVEKLDDGKVKLHASIEANRGLTKIYYKDLKNIEAYKGQPYKFSINLGEDIDNLLGVEVKGLRRVDKVISKVIKFDTNDKFYPSEILQFDGNLHTKNSVEYSMDTSTKDKGWIATHKFKYTKSDKSALSPSNAYALQWSNNDYDSKIHKDSVKDPFKKLLKHGSVGVNSWWQANNERTHVTKLYKRTWFHFFIYPRVFVGDFSHAFKNIKIHPTKGEHITKAWDTGSKKSWDGAYSYYVEAGIANIKDGMLQFDNDDSTMLTIGCPSDDDGKPVCFNTYDNMENTKFPIGTNSDKDTSNISVLFQRSGGVLSAYGIVMNAGKFWNGKLDDPNIYKTYKLYEKTYTKPLQLYFTLDSLNLNKDDTKAYMEWNYRGPDCDDHINFNGIENIYIIDNKVRSLEGPPYYLAHRGEDWEGMTDEQKADVLKFTHTEVPNYDDVQKLFNSGTYQIVTFPNNKYQKVVATCPYIGEAAVFMNKDIELSKLDAVDIDGITVHCKTMTNNDNLKIGSNQVKLVISFDKGNTWHTWNSHVKEWDPIKIQNVFEPTNDDIINMREHGISLDDLNEVNWSTKPCHTRKLSTVRLGIYINNTTATDMVYINSIDFTIVKSKKWEEIYNNNEELEHYIDYENTVVDFEVKTSFNEMKVYLSVFNPEIIIDKNATPKKVEKVYKPKTVTNSTQNNYVKYIVYFIIGIAILVIFGGGGIIYKKRNM